MTDQKHRLFGEFVLDTARGSLLRAGQPVHLRPQAYKTLKYLVENRGRLISKDRLIEEVWEGRAVTDDSLVQCLRDVRQALGEEGSRYLRNERGRGYIFDPKAADPVALKDQTVWSEQVELVRVFVEDVESSDAESAGKKAIPAAAPTTQSNTSHPTSNAAKPVNVSKYQKRAWIIALALIALTAAGVVYSMRFASSGQPIESIAVLPFANASGDPSLEYLSDGLSESLIDRLAELPGVKVIARGSSFKYKGQEVDPREVAKSLGVEALLTGRVVQRGDDLQVRAELVDARTGTQIWGEQYSRRTADIQGIQEKIAGAVSKKLRLRLSGGQERHFGRRATENTQAYQFYLNGLFHTRQGRIEDIRRALDYFNQAVALDPDFALAWAGVAGTYLTFAGNSWLDPKEANAKAKAAAQNALRLDETLPEAHTALATIKQHEWDWAGAEREFKRAIELDPNSVEAKLRYSDYLSLMERHEEALAEIKRAQELDPLQVRLKIREAWALYLARRYDEAIELVQQTIKVSPTGVASHRGLAFIYEGKEMYEEAVAEHEKANSIAGETTGNLCYLGWALARAGKRSEAQAILDKLNTTKEYVSPAELAALYALLGDKERAIALLEKAFAVHDLQLQFLKVASQYDGLRSDQRFQNLLRQVGLPES